MKIALCDDLVEQLEQLHAAVDDFVSRNDISNVVVDEFSSSLLLLEAMENGSRWDICILDVCMPGLDGIALAREMRKRGVKSEIIFISVSSEFAVDAFSLNAVHYVLKPFRIADFDEAMRRAVEAVGKKSDSIMLQLENGVVQAVHIADIIYIESVAYRRVVHTTDGTYEELKRTLSSFAGLLEDLAPGQFIQPYRGYIVNMSAIKTVSPNHMTLSNGDGILIKRGDFRKLRKAFLDWTFGGHPAKSEDE